MYNLIIFVNVNRWFVALRSIISTIGSIHVFDSSGISFSSMRHNAAALSKVSIVGCILSRFVRKVACTRYVVAVSNCSCKVGVWVFAGSSISTVYMSVTLIVSVSSGSFYHIVSSVLNIGCRWESFPFPSGLVSLLLVVVLCFGLRITLSRYRVNQFLIRLCTLVLFAASILTVNS